MSSLLLSVILSRDELVYLLRLFGVSTILGIDNAALDLDEHELNLVLSCAERSLRSRGWVKFNSAQRRIEVDPGIIVLLGSCVIPDYSVLVISVKKDGSRRAAYYHQAAGLTVESTSPEPGLYMFRGAKAISEFWQNIEVSLQLSGAPTLTANAERVSEGGLTIARDVARNGNPIKAVQLLRTEGVSDNVAKHFVESISNPQCNGSCFRVSHHKAGDSQVKGFSFLLGADKLWLMTPNKENNTLWLTTEACSNQTLLNRLSLLFGQMNEVDRSK